MVINFNLLLVWLPMCKYSLTRLACLGINSIRRQREQDINEKRQTNLNQIISLAPVNLNNNYALKNESNLCFDNSSTCCESKLNRLFRKFKSSVEGTSEQLNKWFKISKLNFINSFLIAVDHCKSLHTICATTITIASGKWDCNHQRKRKRQVTDNERMMILCCYFHQLDRNVEKLANERKRGHERRLTLTCVNQIRDTILISTSVTCCYFSTY